MALVPPLKPGEVAHFEALDTQAGAMRRLVAENKEKYPRNG